MKTLSLILVFVLVCSTVGFAKVDWGRLSYGSLCLLSVYLIGQSGHSSSATKERNALAQFSIACVGIGFLAYSF